jgi:hypothetical protein
MNLESFISCLFQVVSNRLWAHTKQEKEHCVKTRSERIELVLHRKKEKILLKKRFLVCKPMLRPFYNLQTSILQGMVASVFFNDNNF